MEYGDDPITAEALIITRVLKCPMGGITPDHPTMHDCSSQVVTITGGPCLVDTRHFTIIPQ